MRRLSLEQAYFQKKDKSLHKHGIEKVGKRRKDFIVIQRDYVDK